MDTEESKKRFFQQGEQEHWSDASKRRRQAQGDTPQFPLEQVVHTDTDVALDLPPVLSVEDMISVPLDFLFRVVPQTTLGSGAASQPARHKPLLSRAEAQCILSVTMLASEIDSLTELSAKALEQRRSYGAFAVKLEQINNPFLRPILPLLHVVGNQGPTGTLERIQVEVEQVTADLKATAVTLRQFSEQNWNLSESLMDSMSGTSGEVVAKEKRRLSDVQEEVCNRIESLVEGVDRPDNDLFQGQVGSMKDYCERLLQAQEEEQAASQSQESVSPQSEAYSKRPGATMSEEKENTHSQSSHQRQQVVLEEVYGSPNASSDTPSCRGVASTQNAAEALSSLSKLSRGGGNTETP